MKQELRGGIAEAGAIQQMNHTLKLQDFGAQPRHPPGKRLIGHVPVSRGEEMVLRNRTNKEQWQAATFGPPRPSLPKPMREQGLSFA
jgi:hypothetical protein